MISSLIIGLIIISIYAYRKQALSFSGVIGFLLIGIVTAFAFSYKGLAILAVFFITANLASKWPHRNQQSTFTKTKPKRTILQVFSNGYMALFAAIGYLILPSPFWIGMLVGAITEANADTWASEIGITSLNPPRSVLNFKVLPRGVSGGITIKGLTASIVGAAIISVLPNILWSSVIGNGWGLFLCYLLIGFFGAYLDSILGECMQIRYRCRICNQLTDKSDHCHSHTTRIKGMYWVTNSTVNAIATGISGLLGGGVLLWFWK